MFNLQDRETIANAASEYLSSLRKSDLIARNVETIEEYRKRYVDSFSIDLRLTFDEDRDLKKAVEIANRALRPYSRLSWKFAICRDDRVENGYPHTHRDIIVLTPMCFKLSARELAKTLVHERVHVYQREFAVETQVLLMNRLGLVLDRVDHPKDIERSNPDLFFVESLRYTAKSTYCSQEYNSNPKSLADSRIRCRERLDVADERLDVADEKTQWFSRFEHPYEGMAYTIADILFSSIESYDPKIIAIFRKWMVEYF